MLAENCEKRPGLSRADVAVALFSATILIGLTTVALERVRNLHGHYPHSRILKSMTLACHGYNDVYKKLPPAFDRSKELPFAASVHVHLLPFLEYEELFKKYLQEGRVDDKVVVFVFLHAGTEDDVGIQNNAANLRVFSDKGLRTLFDRDMPQLAGVEPGSAIIPDSFKDGTSNTMLFASKFARCGEGGSRFAASPDSAFAAFFGQNAAREKAHPSSATATFQLAPSPADCRVRPLMAQSYYDSGLSIALADGSVRYLSPDISQHTWNALLQPNDGQKLGPDWEN